MLAALQCSVRITSYIPLGRSDFRLFVPIGGYMTTTTANTPKVASARTEAAVAANAPEVLIKPINRREFLNYIWGASFALLGAQSAGALVWFLLPRFREGEFGGTFSIDPASLPAVGKEPFYFASGKFWLANTPNGVLAISAVCTHLGCLYKWSEANGRFECPCHGSKFTAEGKWIEGPAPRSLDTFQLTAVTAAGPVTGEPNAPIPADGATALQINTGKKNTGVTH
jgi:cytochrome b6-f complex iron-sulfur subunit